MPNNWYEKREEWEQDRALYEIELRTAFEAASNRRAFWLMGALVCHVLTTLLLADWKALLGYTFAMAAAAMLLWIHSVENKDGRADMRQKIEMKFPEKLTPWPPAGE